MARPPYWWCNRGIVSGFWGGAIIRKLQVHNPLTVFHAMDSERLQNMQESEVPSPRYAEQDRSRWRRRSKCTLRSDHMCSRSFVSHSLIGVLLT
jgi:hypothetical protein